METLKVSDRGTITLPKRIRIQYAIKPNDLIIAEPTPEGILLRPATAVPVEIYTDERLAEFAKEEAKLDKHYGRKKK